MKTNIIVTSSSHLPRYRAGVSFLGAMTFPADRFSAAELHDILSDRLLTVVVGQVLTSADVDGFTAYAAEQAELHPDLYPSPAPGPDTRIVPAAAAEVGERELVSGLEVYPAGSQAAILPAPGQILVNPATAGGTVDQAPHVPPVVVSAHRGRGHSRS